MLLLHPLLSCADAGPHLCTFCLDLYILHPDLCTLLLWCYFSINQRKYSTCTHGGGHWLQLALVAFFLQPLVQTFPAPVVVPPFATYVGGLFPSTHWHTYSTSSSRATCTVWWWSVVVVVVRDVEVVVVAMGWWWFNGTGWLGETTLASILYRPSN